MFDIGFGELLLVMVIGLVVLGPERLPVAVRTVASWIRTLRSLASTVQNELSQELKLQELQESLKKVEKASLRNLSPELKASMDELKEAAETMKRSYSTSPTDEDPSTNQPLNDPEAIHDGVVEVEKTPSSTSEEHIPHSSQVAADLVTPTKPKSEQSPAVSLHQTSDDR
ncbi:Sec-independent protein translocase TatB|uniref:Sec-independent protein translocase protein TatB n=1 Tax=Brenneria salicis ATCC 15712 = DSM 30166 TaxID=714314 RepID=A0A366I1P9_9GAMM|nr:Sec-independent protein translocase protein TatB [Brenneria salicis]NMN90107.1 Sec-independent protein translocase TatB [Brenneria salicis ATCC 15712 = DSM 30166]RBP60474.1 Sec-independent protein translocase TatB [Brenneria salicis ATCC 15712 = DSM 30166]RLM30115.1 twin arginine-targeting protein translocase TatB [Brenneria salicis ATCC 15712 = DSM 30166]